MTDCKVAELKRSNENGNRRLYLAAWIAQPNTSARVKSKRDNIVLSTLMDKAYSVIRELQILCQTSA